MARIIRSPQAEQDTLSIAQYLVEQSQSRSVGYRFIDSVEAKLKLLAHHPLSREARPDLADELRQFLLGNYVLFCRPLDDGSWCGCFTARVTFLGSFAPVKHNYSLSDDPYRTEVKKQNRIRKWPRDSSILRSPHSSPFMQPAACGRWRLFERSTSAD